MSYLVKTPWLLKRLYPSCTWEIPSEEKVLYLTFDDGPHPEATTFVLDELAKYDAKGTFFCIGKNVVENNGLYERILTEGHRVGNHTWKHLNGWKTDDATYINDVLEAGKYIDSTLFRPPYGRISRFQLKQLKEKLGYNIIMWTVLSGDFDLKLTPERCAQNIILHAGSGSIIVFHDSIKAFPRLRVALPQTLSHFSALGYRFSVIPY